MRKVLVLGASGLLGHSMVTELAPVCEVLAPTHRDVDITNYASLEAFLVHERPDVVINTVAVINVDECERDPYTSWQVNALGAGAVARVLGAHLPDTQLIHLSTNYVFGDEKNGYTESDIPKPMNVYGETKAKGEMFVTTYCAKAQLRYHIVRTSWLYSPIRDTFVDSFAKALLRGEKVHAFATQFGNVTYAPHLARAIAHLFIEEEQPSGMYHLFNSMEQEPFAPSRYQVAQCVAAALDVAPSLVAAAGGAHLLGAKRPKHAILFNTKVPPLPAWELTLKEYIVAKYRVKAR